MIVKKIFIALTILGMSIIFLIDQNNVYSETMSNRNITIVSIPSYNKTGTYLDLVSNGENTRQILRLFINDLIFDVNPIYDHKKLTLVTISKKPELQSLYDSIGMTKNSHDVVFIYPSFTQAAYDENGFYDYYNKKCDSKCLTVKIPEKVNGFQSSSINGAWILKLLDYSHIKDQDVDKNPDILKQYKRVIVLHNEYVTKKEFDAITSHPDVVFLYPNVLYAEVRSDYNSNTISLVRGHGYPDNNVRNGFDWKYDASKNEYNLGCENWHFYKRANFTFLNCYPEYRILYDAQLIKSLKNNDPTNLNSLTECLMNMKQTNTNILQDCGNNQKHFPHWVEKSALMMSNGQISRNDFVNLMSHLYEKNIL